MVPATQEARKSLETRSLRPAWAHTRPHLKKKKKKKKTDGKSKVIPYLKRFTKKSKQISKA
jgi:hypothetical protein